MQIPVNILNGKRNILAIWHVPENVHDKVIIFCYGMNGNRVENHRLAKQFADRAEKNSISTIRFDYYGLGVSDGFFQDTSIDDKVSDTMEVINFVLGCYEKSPKVILLGFSDGAKVAYKVSKKMNDTNICLWNPVFNECTFKNEKTESGEMKRKFIRDLISGKLVYQLPFTGLNMNMKYLQEIQDNTFDVIKFIEENVESIFVVLGEVDNKTEKIRKNVKDVKGTQFVIIPNADHIFCGYEQTVLLIESTLNWIMRINA